MPLARPWLAGGAALVAMETLADFGAVSVFNYDTFTTAIYKAWYGLFSIETALGLALLLLAFVAVALAAERLARGRARYTAADAGVRAPVRLALPGARGWAAFAYAAVVFALGFVLPAIALARWAVEVAPLDLDARYVDYMLRTLALAGDGGGRLPRARRRARLCDALRGRPRCRGRRRVSRPSVTRFRVPCSRSAS